MIPTRFLSRAPESASTPSRSRELATFLAFCALCALLATWAAWPLLTLAELPLRDGLDFYGPAFSMLADHLRGGELLLWNPWVGGGRPDAADPQVGVYSPFVLAMALITGGGFAGYAVSLVVAWWLVAVGMFLLGRHLRAPDWGSAAAGLAVLSCGFFVSHIEHFTFVHAMAAVPWITWRLDVALVNRDRLAACQAGALWGLAGLGGYPGVTICTALWIGLWIIGRWLLGDDAGRRLGARDAAIVLCLAVVVATVVLAPAYLAFMVEVRDFSGRAEALHRDTAIAQNALPLGGLRSFASPTVTAIKKKERLRLWPETPHPAMVSVHVGLVVTCLAFLGLVSRRGPPFRFAVLAIGLLFIAAALGSATPIRGWLYDLLPPMRFFRYTAFQRGFGLIALAILALWGTAALARGSGAARSRRLLTLAAAAHGLGLAAAVAIAQVFEATAHVGRTLSRELLWTLLPLAVLLGWCLFVSRRRRLLEVTGVLIVCLVSFETARALRISAPLISVARPDSLLPLLEVEHGRPTAPSLSLDRQPTDGQNNRNLLTGIAEFPSYEPMTSEILTLWRDDEWMSSWLLGEDRIWFARSASARPSRTRLFGKFRRRATKQGRPLLWLHDVDEGLNADPTFPASKIGEGSRRLRQLPVELIDYRHDRLAFSVDAPRDGWLWITDRWAPGWRAQVDGTDVRVYRAGFLFRAVPIPRGPHVVTMRYRPFGHPWLWILSWSTMAAILAATEWRCRSRSLPQPTAAEIDHTFGDPQPGDAQRIDTTPNASPTPDGATEPETQDARPTG